MSMLKCPRNSGCDILIVNPQLGKPGAYLVRAALLQRAQRDAFPVGAYVEILHAGEAGDHLLWEG